MWKPVRDIEKEAYQLIQYYATDGIDKALNKTNKAIKKTSDKLAMAHVNNCSVKRRSSIRLELDSKCNQRDRLELALQLCKELNKTGG